MAQSDLYWNNLIAFCQKNAPLLVATDREWWALDRSLIKDLKRKGEKELSKLGFNTHTRLWLNGTLESSGSVNLKGCTFLPFTYKALFVLTHQYPFKVDIEKQKQPFWVIDDTTCLAACSKWLIPHIFTVALSGDSQACSSWHFLNISEPRHKQNKCLGALQFKDIAMDALCTVWWIVSVYLAKRPDFIKHRKTHGEHIKSDKPLQTIPKKRQIAMVNICVCLCCILSVSCWAE